jgi:hypothetical protein
MIFEPRSLLLSKPSIYLEFDRFIHIFLRHVSEIQTGERFEVKTVFQYKLKDIMRLMELVLDDIKGDIEEHFRNTPTQNFKRHGEMSVYFQGDYYVINIRADGKLMDFYRLGKKK